jgi:hypothetical protein
MYDDSSLVLDDANKVELINKKTNVEVNYMVPSSKGCL